MIDEHRLRELLERRARAISATPAETPKAVRRARRRLALNAAVGTLVGLAVVAGAFAGVRTMQTAPTPANQPTPSPEPTRGMGSLVYGLDGDIYVADWDGANPVRIADGRPADDCRGLDEYFGWGPIWSPDGRYLAYLHANCEGPSDEWWDVVISDPEGNVVTTFPIAGWAVSWSPDSTRVAAWVRTWETIGVYGLDGVRQALFTVPPGMMAPGDSDPAWSPDGASLLVKGGVVVPVDGSTPRKLPSDDPRSREATYSPDGSRVAYTTNGSLVVAAADGSDARQLIGRWVGSPVWSPTGDRIAFTWDAHPGANATELRVLDVATGTVTLLVEAGGSDDLSVIDFSPEGDRILFSRTEDGGAGLGSLWSVNADGSNARRIISGTAWGDWLSPGPTG